MTRPRAPRSATRGRRWLRPLLAAAFVVVPLVEIWVILQVGQLVGPWWTIVLLVLDSMIGAWLIKREGGRAWRALREALQNGRMPARELADGALILVGGTLMLSPGFVLDLAGILLIWPVTRPIARQLLTSVVERRLLVVPHPGLGGFPGFPGTGQGPGNGGRPGPGPDGPVVRGDVVE
jgi:UPF0716 protein FxsA